MNSPRARAGVVARAPEAGPTRGRPSRRVGAGAAVALLGGLLASCGGGAKAETFPVQVDGKSSAFNFEATAYFPDQVTVHPGDTVDFTSVFRGEPHTVTFGTLV